MTERLKALYQSVILKHNNTPVHFVKNESAAYVIKANSPVCGDRFTIYFDVLNGVITNLSFYGYGCAVSKASASILCEKLNGQSLKNVQGIVNQFFEHLDPESNPENPLEVFEAFSAVQYFPGRRQCATLSWEEMTKLLKTIEGND